MAVQLTTLANGLRIVTENRPALETVSLGIWVDAGSRHERAAENGIAHCLEHMVFKGTTKRSARAIAVDIERVGGHLNAFTTRDHTCYYARVLKEDTALAFDIVADLILEPSLDDGELAKEKQVIIQEIGQNEDTPDDLVFDHLQAACFGNHRLARNILGTPETVNSLSARQLRDFMDRHYSPGDLVVSLTGNFDHQAFVDMVSARFSTISRASHRKHYDAGFEGRVIRDARDLEQTHIALGLPGVGYDAPDYFSHQVFSVLFGGGMSSRLFQSIREEQGLAYSVYSFASPHAETGLFGIYAGTAPDAASALLEGVQRELSTAADTLTEEEVDIAKAQLKAGLMMALESTTGRMEQLGRQTLLFGTPPTTKAIIEDVEKVSLEDVARVAAGLAASDTSALALIGEDIDRLSFAA